MAGHIRVLSIALGVILALSAFAAPVASAGFNSEASSTTLTGTPTTAFVFTYSGGVQVSCLGSFSHSTMSAAESSEITVTTTFGEESCTGPLGLLAHLKTNGCDQKLTTSKGGSSGTTHILCPAGKSITISMTSSPGTVFCTLHIAAQTPTNPKVKFTNMGSGSTREIEAEYQVTGVHATRTGSALCGPASSTTGTFSGGVRFTGELVSLGIHIGIWTA